MQLNTIVQADALEFCRGLPDQSMDAIITDPPYGTTHIAWDKAIDWSILFPEFLRVVKPRGAIVLFGTVRNCREFTPLMWTKYRYDWVWVKTMPTQFLNAKVKPLQLHELLFVFSHATHVNGAVGATKTKYHPQMTRTKPPYHKRAGEKTALHYSPNTPRVSTHNNGERYPTTVLQFSNGTGGISNHPTGKPLDLLQYLVSTYTLESETVLDPFMGSGTTALAARNAETR